LKERTLRAPDGGFLPAGHNSGGATGGGLGRAERDVLVLGDSDPEPIDARTIRDPVNEPLAVLEETYARIERCVRGLPQTID